MTKPSAQTLRHFLQHLFLRLLFGGLSVLPYRWRVPLFGWVTSRVIAPFAGYDRRIRENLALVWPDLPPDRVEALVRAVPDNTGRTLMEVHSPAALRRRVHGISITGEGLAAILTAQQVGRPVILVSGHFGNYDVPRAALAELGHPVAGLYKAAKNPFFNEHYVEAIARVSGPVFSTERRGVGQMVAHIRAGGIIGILCDLHAPKAENLRFFGHPARTALSAAQLALKYDCLMVPVYGLRLPDGLNFELIVEPPIPHSDPASMMQAVNDSLEARVRRNPEQWFWIHRRWKP